MVETGTGPTMVAFNSRLSIRYETNETVNANFISTRTALINNYQMEGEYFYGSFSIFARSPYRWSRMM